VNRGEVNREGRGEGPIVAMMKEVKDAETERISTASVYGLLQV
jgi:hypothetical protein